MPSPRDPARLPTGTLLAYGLPGLGSGFMTGLVLLYLLKYATDVLLVAPGAVGLLFGLARLWDAVSDPLVGHWSDRTRGRLGRRRPWMLAAALPLALAFAAVWSPPPALAGQGLVLWLGAAMLLFYTAQTAFNIPHVALGAELSPDHHERTRVFLGRAGFDLLGALLAAGGLALLERSEAPRAAAAALSLGAGLASAALIGLATARLREPVGHLGRGGASPTRAFGDVLRNPHALRLVAVLFLEALGFSAMTSAMPFATEYALGLQGMTGAAMGGAIGAMILALPIWLPLSRRLGKRRVWLATLWLKAAAFASLLFAPSGEWVPLLAAVAVIGATHGCGLVIGPSMKADVVDDDELRSGERKEGAYFASWNLAVKASGGLAIALSGTALGLSGFVPNAPQDPAALAVIRGLFAGFPCVFYVLAAGLLAGFRLDEAEHRRIRAALAERTAGTWTSDRTPG